MSAMKKIPLRKCAGCNEMKPKQEMVRVIKDENDNLSLDLTGKKNGRGAYICRSKDCLLKAIKTKGIERSLKMSVPEDIYEQLEKELQING